MSPWRQSPAEALPLPGGGVLPLEIRGVPARHRDLWVLLHPPGPGASAETARYLLRRFRETAAVAAIPDLRACAGPAGEGLDAPAASAGLDALDARFGRLCGRLFLAGFASAGLLAAAWALRNPGRASGVVLLSTELARSSAEMEPLEQGLATPALLVYRREQGSPWEAGADYCRRAAGPVELVVLPGGGLDPAAAAGALFERIRAFWRGAAPRPARPRRVRDASRPKTVRRKRRARGG